MTSQTRSVKLNSIGILNYQILNTRYVLWLSSGRLDHEKKAVEVANHASFQAKELFLKKDTFIDNWVDISSNLEQNAGNIWLNTTKLLE